MSELQARMRQLQSEAVKLTGGGGWPAPGQPGGPPPNWKPGQQPPPGWVGGPPGSQPPAAAKAAAAGTGQPGEMSDNKAPLSGPGGNPNQVRYFLILQPTRTKRQNKIGVQYKC